MKRQPEINYSQSNNKYENIMQGLLCLPTPDIIRSGFKTASKKGRANNGSAFFDSFGDNLRIIEGYPATSFDQRAKTSFTPSPM